MPYLLFLSFALLIGLYINKPLADPDLWWHVVAGRWMLANWAVPTQDMWTQFASGKSWLAYSWSNEIVYALTDRLFSISGLFYLQALLAVALAASLFYALGKVSGSSVLGCLLGAVIVVACQGHFTLRPQVLIWILFSLLLLNCESALDQGYKKSHLIWTALIFCVWANTHISAAIGLAVLALWIMPFPLKFEKKLINPVIIIIAVGFLATLLTPYLGREWLIFFSKTDHPFKYSSVQEFAPSTILNVTTSVLILMTFLAAMLWQLNKSAVNVFQLAALSLLVLAALLVVKFAPFALICMGFVLARQWRSMPDSQKEIIGLVQAIAKLEAAVNWIPVKGLTFFILCCAWVNYSQSSVLKLSPLSLPVAAADLMQQEKLPLPLMNTFSHGGYLMYRFSDLDGNTSAKVSIDGRTNLIAAEDWKIYQKAWTGNWGWKEYLEKVKPETIIWRADSPLVRILEAEGQWCTVSGNKNELAAAVLMLKREAVRDLQQKGSKLSCLNPG